MNLSLPIHMARKAVRSARRRFLWNYRINHRDRGVLGYIDIGAVEGLPRPWDRNAYRIRFYLGFEPNEEPRRLENGYLHNSAVWSCAEERTFYVSNTPQGTGSSLLEPNFDYVRAHYGELKQRGPRRLAETWFDRSRVVRTFRVRCETLDSVIERTNSPVEFHFAKIDAQGAELQILQGARRWLAESAVGLQLECFEIPLYKDMALFDDIKRYLEKIREE